MNNLFLHLFIKMTSALPVSPEKVEGMLYCDQFCDLMTHVRILLQRL